MAFTNEVPKAEQEKTRTAPVELVGEETGDGSCVITRKIGTTTLHKTKVLIDGVEMGEIGEGESLPLTLRSGEHLLTIRTGKRERATPLVIGNGDTTIVQFKCTDGSFEKDNSRHKILKNELIPRDVGVPNYVLSMQQSSAVSPASPAVRTSASVRLCPKCNGPMTIQTVTESRKTGCFTIILYILLCLTILGILIVIPLALRRKTETVTYAVCQNCGFRERRYGQW